MQDLINIFFFPIPSYFRECRVLGLIARSEGLSVWGCNILVLRIRILQRKVLR